MTYFMPAQVKKVIRATAKETSTRLYRVDDPHKKAFFEQWSPSGKSIQIAAYQHEKTLTQQKLRAAAWALWVERVWEENFRDSNVLLYTTKNGVRAFHVRMIRPDIEEE